MDSAEQAELAAGHVRRRLDCLIVDLTDSRDRSDIADVGRWWMSTGLYATVGSVTVLLEGLVAVQDGLHAIVSSFDGHVSADDPALDISLLLDRTGPALYVPATTIDRPIRSVRS